MEPKDLREQRVEKLADLQAKGIDPYPHRYRRTHTSAEAMAQFEREEQQNGGAATQENSPEWRLAGRLVSTRGMGKVTFAHIQDGAGRIQLFFRRDALGPETYSLLKDLDIGDIIGVSGRMFRTKTGEPTLQVSALDVLAKSLLPLPEKWHGLQDVEKRYRQRYLDLIASESTREVFASRSKMISAIRAFMQRRGYVEVETPILHGSAGGAAARPFVTHHNALDRTLYLRIATELHLKRLVVGGFEKVFEIGRIFRNEGISTKHNPEFTMMESYEAYADYGDMMALVEDLAASAAREVLGAQKVTFDGQEIDLTPPWRRITLRDAILDNSGIDFYEYPDTESLRARLDAEGLRTDPTQGRGKLIDELLSVLVEPKLIQPTILYDYPVELSPLAKRRPDNPALVERFEAFIAGFEVANAYTELNNPIDQRERFMEQLALRAAGDEEVELIDEDFLQALEHGMPPTGGLGVGIDRLAMILTNQQSIREVILFPALRVKG
ncbi:MAG: lysine--tRNA ligase [Chloroflexota bacterium]|nr:MAG: lysine--tRNA ligase [Chloroflexota bacterium]